MCSPAGQLLELELQDWYLAPPHPNPPAAQAGGGGTDDRSHLPWLSPRGADGPGSATGSDIPSAPLLHPTPTPTSASLCLFVLAMSLTLYLIIRRREAESPDPAA